MKLKFTKGISILMIFISTLIPLQGCDPVVIFVGFVGLSLMAAVTYEDWKVDVNRKVTDFVNRLFNLNIPYQFTVKPGEDPFEVALMPMTLKGDQNNLLRFELQGIKTTAQVNQEGNEVVLGSYMKFQIYADTEKLKALGNAKYYALAVYMIRESLKDQNGKEIGYFVYKDPVYLESIPTLSYGVNTVYAELVKFVYKDDYISYDNKYRPDKNAVFIAQIGAYKSPTESVVLSNSYGIAVSEASIETQANYIRSKSIDSLDFLKFRIEFPTIEVEAGMAEPPYKVMAGQIGTGDYVRITVKAPTSAFGRLEVVRDMTSNNLYGHGWGHKTYPTKEKVKLLSDLINISGPGEQSVQFKVPEDAGEYFVKLKSLNGGQIAEGKIKVGVSGLVPLTGGLGLTLNGGESGPHQDNHYGQPEVVAAIEAIGEQYYSLTGKTLSINDMSLPYGGKFDINGSWLGDHTEHRAGYDVDVNDLTAPGGMETSEWHDKLKDIVENLNYSRSIVKNHTNHAHISFD